MRGPIPNTMQQRREAVASGAAAPLSYDKQLHEVTATLSKGSPVQRLYGIESLEISARAIDLSRIEQGGVPLLDHHSQAGIDQILGKVTSAWVAGGALMGRIKFAQTKRGQIAEGMVARREISSLSIGYSVTDWRVSNSDGDVIDPEHDRIAWDEDG
jgi:hypothetical protein